MSVVHRMHPDPGFVDPDDAILFDRCKRCAQHAHDLTSLDDTNLRALYVLALDWNITGNIAPRTYTERQACERLWRGAVVHARLFPRTTRQQLIDLVMNDTPATS